MLSKDEILKKKGKSPEQLDLVKGLDSDTDKFKKRLLLLSLLFLFVGSSAGLWFYREYQANNLSFNFSLPVFPQFSPAVPTDKNAWQVCLFDQKDSSLIYSKNCSLSQMPDAKIKENVDLIKSSLPNGLIISETISTSSSEINYLSAISSPKFSCILTIKIFGSYSLDNSKSLIPKLASDLYWRWSR